MAQPASHFNDLFFSNGVLPHGSVKEYFTRGHGRSGGHRRRGRRARPAAADTGLVRQQQLRHRQSHGRRRAPTSWRRTPPSLPTRPSTSDRTTTTATGSSTPSSWCTLGAAASRPATRRHLVAQVDASRRVYNADGTQIFAYLTIPEDAPHRRLRARAGSPAVRLPGPLRHRRHLGRRRQLVPDGRRFLEWRRRHSGASSAWCKVNQGWATVTNVTAERRSSPSPTSRTAATCIACGRTAPVGSEYFLLENRQRTGYDANLPATACSSGTSMKRSRATPTRTTTRSDSSRPTPSATSSWRRTAATPAIPTLAPRPTRL